MTAKYEIQIVSQAFSGRIPEQLWKPVAHAETIRGAYRHYIREHRWFHPQQNAWTGHVRVIDTTLGEPVHIERVESSQGVQYEAYPLI